MATAEHVEDVKAKTCVYFAVHQYQTVGWHLLQSQLSTNLEGQCIPV
jgi:hypothetical protein